MRTKLFLLLVMVMSIAFSAYSQGQQNATPEERAKRSTQMVKETTGIDAATAVKVEAVFLKYAKEMVTLREKYTDREARREPMAELNKKQDADLKALFTADQFAKYTAKMEEMRKNRPGGQGRPQ